MHAAQEADLVDPEVAEARHRALVEEGGAERVVGTGREAGHGERRVPVVAQRVRPEVADGRALVAGGDQVDHGQVAAPEGAPVVEAEAHAHLVLDPLRHALAGAGDRPRTLHAQVRVEGGGVVEPHEQVLAVRVEPGDPPAAEPRARPRAGPELPVGDERAADLGAEAGGEDED